MSSISSTKTSTDSTKKNNDESLKTLTKALVLSNIDIMQNQRISTNILLKKWWFMMIVIGLLVGFIVLFLLDIYLGFEKFISWFDSANKQLQNAIPGGGFAIVLSYRHPFMSGLWYSNKAFPTAVIYAYQYPNTNSLLTQSGGENFLLTMWQYAEGLILQPPNQFSVCQEPTQDLDVPGCIICSAFSQNLQQLCLETCPGTNFSWTSAISNIFGTSAMGLMTGAALGGPIGAGIGGLLSIGLAFGTQLFEQNQAKQQCVSQRENSMCNLQNAPPC